MWKKDGWYKYCNDLAFEVILFFVTALFSCERATKTFAFVQPSSSCKVLCLDTTRPSTLCTPASSISLQLSRGNEEYLPETSFGAEVVPEGQRPVNEYLDMKRAPLFGWASNEVGLDGLLLRLGIIYVLVFATIGYPIAGATFTQDGFLLQKVAASNVGTLGLVLLILIRLYSGWGYVASRLKSRVIEYEETGWFDGNFEKKTEAELKRDQFLHDSDVKPAVDRLQQLTLAVAALWVASCIGLNAATSMKPVFNEYDPSILERVRFDEDLANKAAQQSGGKPTYCDNRYYRAVANGGQGCN